MIVVSPVSGKLGCCDYMFMKTRPSGALESVGCCCHTEVPGFERLSELLRLGLAVEQDGGDHLIELREDGWTIQHPLIERVEDTLFDCGVTWTGGDVGVYGRFVMKWDEHQDDWVLGERLADHEWPEA